MCSLSTISASLFGEELTDDLHIQTSTNYSVCAQPQNAMIAINTKCKCACCLALYIALVPLSSLTLLLPLEHVICKSRIHMPIKLKYI